MLLATLLVMAGVNSTPQPGVPQPDYGPLYQPCAEQVDALGDLPGGNIYRTGMYECTFVLSDPARAPVNVALKFTFKKSGIVPLDDDLADLGKLEDIPETPDGNNWRPSLHLGGDFASYRKPRFEGEAEFYLMPRWRDDAAQDAAVPGHDWPEAADAPGTRCEAAPQPRCRTVARADDALFIVAIYRPRDEPLTTTAAALRAFVADW